MKNKLDIINFKQWCDYSTHFMAKVKTFGIFLRWYREIQAYKTSVVKLFGLHRLQIAQKSFFQRKTLS